MSSEIDVWAPFARTVTLVAGEREFPTRPTGDGHFRGGPLPEGVEYLVRLDDAPPRPDPRSRHQPRGVHGPSRVKGTEFAWRDQAFRAPPLADALLYELHVGTFTAAGTFAAAAEQIEYLEGLGVTHVALMPVATFPGRWGWGYDGASLFAPHPSYGAPDDLKRFVARCHELGLAVTLDVVYNHLGPDGNYLAEFGPYFTDRHTTPWGRAINLDGRGSDEVRRFLIDNARQWLAEYHLDGLRLDAVHALHDQSAIPFLEQLAAEIDALAVRLERPLVLIGESDLNDPRLVTPRGEGGIGLSAQWSDDFHHALHALLTGERAGYYADFGGLGCVARALTDGYVYTGQYSGFRQRSFGRALGSRSGHALLGYLQTHDQIGNRARGERIGQLVSPGRLRIGAALVQLAPFVPMLFQGEEWAAGTPFLYFTDHTDPQLADAVRRGRREEFRAFGWQPSDVPDPQAEATFRASVLDWDEPAREPHADVLAWYRALIALRAATPELRDGRRDLVRVRFDEGQGWLTLERGPIRFQANLGERPIALPAALGTPLLGYPELPRPGARGVQLAPDGCLLSRIG